MYKSISILGRKLKQKTPKICHYEAGVSLGGGNVSFYIITTPQTGGLRVVVAPLTDQGGLGFHFNVDYRHSAHDEGKLIITQMNIKITITSIHTD